MAKGNGRERNGDGRHADNGKGGHWQVGGRIQQERDLVEHTVARHAAELLWRRLKNEEFAAEAQGYTATKHQREVGAGYFDRVFQSITGGAASTAALSGSTESAQF